MCRIVVFSGTCTRCNNLFTWDDLSQQLSCLEAKNAGVFGECRRGIHKEEHQFDQECPTCEEEVNADEGVELEDILEAGGKSDGREEDADQQECEDGRQRKKQRRS
jgi:hypothetical protein